MSQNVGTLVSAAIRPNDSNDPIASAFASEIKGGLHTYNTINDRDNIIIERRDWGMLCYVIGEDKTYQLKYGFVTTNIMDNSNWVEYNGSGEVNEWLDSVISVAYQSPATYSVGDRYLAGKSINDSLLGSWSAFNPGVVLEWNSVSWVSTEPSNGSSVRIDNENNSIYIYDGDFPDGFWYKEMLSQIRSIEATSIDGQSYTSSSLVPFDNYVKDMLFLTKFDTVNSGATVSININSMGSVPIRKPSSGGLINLVIGDIITDVTYSLVYNGSVFELIKHYSNGENALNIKYYIGPSEHFVIPPYHQYWVYGNLTIDGYMTNYGQVIIANGSLVNSNNFFNYGTVSLIQFDAGTASPTSNLSVGDYESSLTFTNITSIKFKGESLETSNFVRVTGDDPNEITVWIPPINSFTNSSTIGIDGTDGYTFSFDVMVNPSTGLTVSSTGVEINYGHGLTISSNQLVADITIGGGLTFSETGSNGTLQIAYDSNTLSLDGGMLKVISGFSRPVYDIIVSDATYEGINGTGSVTNVTISATPSSYSRIEVYVNGQKQLLGSGVTNTDCWFGGTNSALMLDQIEKDNSLVWNAESSGFFLEEGDVVEIVYEKQG